MSLLSDIETAATTSTEPLADLLRRCKVLAARLKHAEFGAWVTRELNGYDDYDDNEDALPTYRLAATPVSQGSLVGSFGRQAKNIPLSLHSLPAELRETLVQTEFRQSIGALQELAKNEKGLRRQWDQTIVGMYGKGFYEDMVLVSAWVNLPPGTIVGILDTVRTRVLDFVLAIQAENPEAGESALNAAPPIQPQQVTNIFHSTIVGGHANIGTTGSASIDNSDATTTLTLDGTKRGKLESLIKAARADAEKLPKGRKAKATAALDKVAKAAATKRLDPKEVRRWAAALASVATIAAPSVDSLAHYLEQLVGST